MPKQKKSNFKKWMTGIWYVLTSGATALLTALLLGIVLSDNPEPWMFWALAGDVVLIITLITTKKFTTSETIAYKKR